MRLRFLIIGLLAAGALAAAVFAGFRMGKARQAPFSTLQADVYPLLSHRIFADNPKDPLINFSHLRSELSGYYTKNSLTGSLYFEYLPTGTSIRINGSDKSAAASLLKVPLAMEVYKAVELQKINPKKQITLTADQLDSAFGSLYQKGAGYTLPLSEMVKIMLVDSDNTALKAIADAMDGVLPPDTNVFNYLDIEIQQDADLSIEIDARSYTSILKCLYFTCYLNKDDSQTVLSYLTQTPFDNRLVAGIDDTLLKIAHKIGVFQDKTQSDCGIIYPPNRPYALCIMIDGQDNDMTNHHIAELSRMVYKYVTKQ